MSIFISPHNDDETLFGAFTLLRERPLVVIVFDSVVQERRGLPVTWMQRRAETTAACCSLGVRVAFLGLPDDRDMTSNVIEKALRNNIGRLARTDQVYAPAEEDGGHPHHNLVAEAVSQASHGANVTRYLTYTTRGKSVSSRPVPITEPAWIRKKLRALACYESQFNLDPRMGCWPHFLRSQEEYYQ